MQAVIEQWQRALALREPIGSTRLFTVELSAPIAAVAGTIAQAEPLQFREEGIVVAFSGQEVTATAAKYAMTELRLQIGSEDIISNGQGGSYAPFLTLFPPGQPYFSMLRRVRTDVPWIFSFKNQDGAATCTPKIVLGFIADADMRRMAR